ncbi:hypothetical protein [Microvirga massiliensis]|uniref:hypothetical protein n=1 Tax=Microvirga massiliensis TaxID=1033741 RepID=UPI00062B5EBC|nr:hypothetical protein [Microvirga massiliensis]
MIPGLFADYDRIYRVAPSHTEGMQVLLAEIESDYPDEGKRRAFMKNFGYFHPDWGVSDVVGLVRLDVSEEIRDETYERLWAAGRGVGVTDLILTFARKDPAAYEEEVHRLAALPQWNLLPLPDNTLTVVRSVDYVGTAAA